MNPVFKYFNGERMECLVAVVLGLITLLTSFILFLQVKRPFYNGMASSLLLSVIQVVICTAVYFNDAKQMTRVIEFNQSDSSRILTEELPRMEGVMKSFKLYRWVEISTLLLGLILFFAMPRSSFWRGAGIGLALISLQLLVLDVFDERRGNVYLSYLRAFTKY